MILAGIARLGRDVEVKYTASGEAVATLALAFNYGKKGADGDRPSQWIEASLWGKQAESLAQNLTKGSLLSVVISDPNVQTFPKKDGIIGAKLVGRVTSIEFAGGGNRADTNQGQPTRQPQPTPQARAKGVMQEYSDDDMPF